MVNSALFGHRAKGANVPRVETDRDVHAEGCPRRRARRRWSRLPAVAAAGPRQGSQGCQRGAGSGSEQKTRGVLPAAPEPPSSDDLAGRSSTRDDAATCGVGQALRAGCPGCRAERIAGEIELWKWCMSSPITYEVRISGEVSEDALEDLGDVDVTTASASTVLSGSVADQAALLGLLARLRSLGLEITEVRRVPPVPPQRDKA